MPRTIFAITFTTILAATASAQAADAERPQVLILGDSIYSEASRELQKELKGRVDVVYAPWEPGEVADTTTALEHLDRLLGYVDRNGKPVPQEKQKKWDLIHFNFGLGDLIHRAPNMKSFRVMPIYAGGVRNTDAKHYEAKLQELVQRLRSTGAKLVWASTTPIRQSADNLFKQGTEIEYNAIAARVMKEHGVPINDMYSFVKEQIAMDKPSNADPFYFDRKPIHKPILDAISSALNLPTK